MSQVRILVVDDFEPWRRFVLSTLKKRPELQVIFEASDGLEAVQKAEELRPDLILLDIGLPRLNGIEAARRIRKAAPDSKILFVSQESSADVAQEALRSGAWGYVIKAHAGSELLSAVEAVIRGQRFVSASFGSHVSLSVADEQTPIPLERKEVLSSSAPTVPRKAGHARCHEVQFCADDAGFLDGFTSFIGSALRAGNAVILVATELHRESLLQRLHSHGLDIGALIEQGRYTSLDVADTLSRFMVNGFPDPARFREVASGLIATAAKAAKGERPRVAACGECAPVLWAKGKPDAAIRLEQLWDQMARTHEVDILCGYPLGSFHRAQDSHVFQRIFAEHSAVYPAARAEI
jgi:DNA-binding NarL/FixJ family response regulator